MKKNISYIKAVRKANRELELENEMGWVSKTKKHKRLKDYKRSEKKFRYLIDMED